MYGSIPGEISSVIEIRYNRYASQTFYSKVSSKWTNWQLKAMLFVAITRMSLL